MESIAAPKSYLDCRLEGSSYKVFLNPVSAHGQVSKEHVVLVHEHWHEHSAQLRLGNSATRGLGPRGPNISDQMNKGSNILVAPPIIRGSSSVISS